MNPDADTQRIVFAEQFERVVADLIREGYDRLAAEARVAVEHPHLACAAEQLRQPVEAHAEILRRFFPR